jgi:hypothetical protein
MPDGEGRSEEFVGKTFSQISDVVNDKVIGMFVQETNTFNGHKYFYDDPGKLRNGYRFLLRVESYPNAGLLVIPLPIEVNEQFIVSQVWGSASKPPTATGAGDGEYFSFFSEGDSRITFVMTDTEVTITTTANMTAYSGFIIVDNILDGQ